MRDDDAPDCMTVEEHDRLTTDDPRRTELIDGELVVKSPAGRTRGCSTL